MNRPSGLLVDGSLRILAEPTPKRGCSPSPVESKNLGFGSFVAVPAPLPQLTLSGCMCFFPQASFVKGQLKLKPTPGIRLGRPERLFFAPQLWSEAQVGFLELGELPAKGRVVSQPKGSLKVWSKSSSRSSVDSGGNLTSKLRFRPDWFTIDPGRSVTVHHFYDAKEVWSYFRTAHKEPQAV